MTNYILAPTPKWAPRDKLGLPIVNGKVWTYANFTRTIPKPTFQDPAGLNPNNNPIELDAAGEAVVYWMDDDFYSIEIYDADGSLVDSEDNYPNVNSSGGGDITVVQQSNNMVRNPQFSHWTPSGERFLTDILLTNVKPSVNNTDYYCDDWTYYTADGTDATNNLSRQLMPLGDSSVPGTPVYFHRFTCTTAGTGETAKRIEQTYISVETLNNSEVSFSIWAKSSSLSTFQINLAQIFGTGGSAEVVTEVLTATLSNSWTQYNAVITMPSIAGKTLGANGDCLKLRIELPLNQTCSIDLVNVQMIPGGMAYPFSYQTINETFKHLDFQINQNVFQTGDIKYSLYTFAPAGWILASGTNTLGNISSGATYELNSGKALFYLMWNNFSTLIIYAKDGTVTTRGTSAEADWNAFKRLQVLGLENRVFVMYGTHAFGTLLGEETHTLTEAEMPAHTHPGALNFSGGAGNLGGTGQPIGVGTGITGGSAPHNNMQPTFVGSVFIKL
jgi:hypothetical protein